MKREFITFVLLFLSSIVWGYDFEVDGIYYNITSNEDLTAEVTRNEESNSYSGAVVIPSQVEYQGNNYKVTAIGNSAFYQCLQLTSVEIPNTIQSIGDYSFYRCLRLSSVEIPNSATSIGYSAFYECSGLTSVSIPNTITTISWYAFYGCSGLTSVEIPNSVQLIAGRAFGDCTGLQSIYLPSSVLDMDYNPFCGCYNVKTVTVDPQNERYNSNDNCNAIIETETHKLVSGFPSTVIPTDIETIGVDAFDCCQSLKGIVLPNSVKKIERSAFYECHNLTSVTLPLYLDTIEDTAFSGCYNLQTLVCKNGTPPSTNYNIFINMSPSLIDLYVPSTHIDSYKNTTYWKDCNVLPYYVSETGIGISTTSMFLKSGVSENLIAVDVRADGLIDDFNWTSSNPDVATVDENGRVTAVSPGTAQITVSPKDNTAACATCAINVVESGSNSVYAKDVMVIGRTAVTIPVYMDNAETIGNVQFDMVLPENTFIGEITKGEDRFDSSLDHTLTYKALGENTYRVSLISTTNSTIYNTDSEGADCRNTSPIVNIEIWYEYISIITGTHEVLLKNIVLSNNIDGVTNKYTCGPTTSLFTVPVIHDVVVTSNDTSRGNIEIQGEGYNKYLKAADENCQIVLTATSKTGYNFNCWLKDEEKLSSDNPFTLTVTEDINLVAEFLPNKHTVKFIADGNIVSEQVLDYGSEIIAPEAPEKTGYTFYSWGDVPTTVPDYDLEFVADYLILGDVYDDGTIDVADVTKLAGIVSNNIYLSDREKKQADVFEDNSIDVADISELVNIALSYTASTNAPMANDVNTGVGLTTEIFRSASGDCTLSLGLMNIPDGVKALQFDMQLPVGVNIVSASLNNMVCPSHSLQTYKMADGIVRMIIFTFADEVMNLADGNIVNINLDSSNNDGDICISNIVFVDTDSEKQFADNSVLSLTSAPTGIGNLARNGLYVTYGDGFITICCDEDRPISICSTSGTSVYSGKVSADHPLRVPVGKGVYLVNNTKLLVK